MSTQGSPNTVVTDNVRRLVGDRTQRMLAAELGISQESVSRYLRGKARWSIDAIYAWAPVLDATVDDLIYPHPES